MTKDHSLDGIPLSPEVIATLSETDLASWEPARKPTEECMKNFMSLEKLFEILREKGFDMKTGIPICLEPKAAMEAKLAAGKIEETWDLILREHPELRIPTWDIMRPKGDLFRISILHNIAGNYDLPMTEEEPTAESEKVGKFIMTVYDNYVEMVVVRDPSGHPHLTMVGGSVSKVGDEIPPDAEFLGLYLTNFQRLYGRKILGGAPVSVYVRRVDDLPDIDNSKCGVAPEGGWTLSNMPAGFKKLVKISKVPKMTRDGRTLACVAMYLSEEAEKTDILQRVSNVATFADLTLQEASELIKLSKPEREELEHLLAECS